MILAHVAAEKNTKNAAVNKSFTKKTVGKPTAFF